jgi:hypothetical protein
MNEDDKTSFHYRMHPGEAFWGALFPLILFAFFVVCLVTALIV